MLDSYNILLAVGGVREAYVLDTVNALNLLNEGDMPRRSTRRLWHVALIAALLTALLTACAVGYSIHQRRQQELRARFEVEEKHVDAWVDYDVPTAAEPAPTAPTLTLLSTYNDGVFCKVYVNASPVEESEVVPLIEQEQLDDGWWHWLEYRYSVQGGEYTDYAHPFWTGELEYGPEDYRDGDPVEINGVLRPPVKREAQIREMKRKCYDPATKTMTFCCPILLERIDPDRPVSVELVLWDQWQRGERYDFPEGLERHGEVRRSLGTVSFDLTPPRFCSVRFENPPVFYNEERGKTGRVLGADISATEIIWYLAHEEQDVAHYAVKWEGDRANEQFGISLSWINCIDDLLRGATLNFDDGTSLPCGGFISGSIVDGEVELVSYHSGDEMGTTEATIDIHKLVSLTIAGETFALPPIRDSEN